MDGKWKRVRTENITTLRIVARQLDELQRRYDEIKLATKSMNVISGCLSVVTLLSGGTLLPVLAGGLGGSSFVLSKLADLPKWYIERGLLQNAQKAWDDDYKETEKLINAINKRTKQNCTILDGVEGVLRLAAIPGQCITATETLGEGICGIQSDKCKTISKKINASKTGKAIKAESDALGIVLFLFDIFHFIQQVEKCQKGSCHDAAVVLREIADTKEEELRKLEKELI